MVPNPNLQDLLNSWNRSLLKPFTGSLSSLFSIISASGSSLTPGPIMLRILVSAFAALIFSLIVHYKWKWNEKNALFAGLLVFTIAIAVNICFDILIFGSIQ